jgi:hypothetical protein
MRHPLEGIIDVVISAEIVEGKPHDMTSRRKEGSSTVSRDLRKPEWGGTRHVKVLRRNGKPSRGRVSPAQKPLVPPKVLRGPKQRRPKKPPKPVAYRHDKTRGAEPSKRVCIAMTPSEHDELDRLARAVQMNKSHLVRQAVSHFGATLFPAGTPKEVP